MVSENSEHDNLLVESAVTCACSSHWKDTNDDVNLLMLRAIEPPDHSDMTLPGILHLLKYNIRRKRAFKQLILRGQMNVWTLRFQPEYEQAFCAYTSGHAFRRVRAAMALGFVFVAAKAIADVVVFDSTSSANEATWTLYVYFALPVLLAAFACTFVRRLNGYYEWYSAVPFLVLTAALTAQKIIEHSRGPVIPLFVVFIPLFGITRLRFTTSVLLVFIMLLGHMTSLWVLQSAESWTDVLFQGYNYLGGIAMAGICHYREEVLRRRNFILMLPFCQERFDSEQVLRDLHDPRTRKQVLMNRATLKFKNPFVEAAFYNYWYLIDSCPFEHPNCGKLHFRVYLTARFAVIAAVFSQLLLSVQDWQYLRPRSSGFLPFGNVYTTATALRFGLVIPAFLAIPAVMVLCGRKYYRTWRAHAADASRGGVVSPSSANRRWSFLEEGTTSPNMEFQALVSPAASIEDGIGDEADRNSPTWMNNQYARTVQQISTAILFVYASCMGIILVLADNRASANNKSAAPCYFLGFLNAILFLHRSSFRVRFVYATLGSLAATAITLIVVYAKYNSGFYEYAMYSAIANLLGMMVSHEEESLRRIFFTRMTLRSEEFRLRHDAIAKIEPLLKSYIRKRRNGRPTICVVSGYPKVRSDKIPTVNQILQAGRTLALIEMGKAGFAFIMELAT